MAHPLPQYAVAIHVYDQHRKKRRNKTTPNTKRNENYHHSVNVRYVAVTPLGGERARSPRERCRTRHRYLGGEQDGRVARWPSSGRPPDASSPNKAKGGKTMKDLIVWSKRRGECGTYFTRGHKRPGSYCFALNHSTGPNRSCVICIRTRYVSKHMRCFVTRRMLLPLSQLVFVFFFVWYMFFFYCIKSNNNTSTYTSRTESNVRARPETETTVTPFYCGLQLQH